MDFIVRSICGYMDLRHVISMASSVNINFSVFGRYHLTRVHMTIFPPSMKSIIAIISRKIMIIYVKAKKVVVVQ